MSLSRELAVTVVKTEPGGAGGSSGSLVEHAVTAKSVAIIVIVFIGSFPHRKVVGQAVRHVNALSDNPYPPGQIKQTHQGTRNIGIGGCLQYTIGTRQILIA